MPTRIIRDGILTSERVNLLTPNAELFYRRLMSVTDDYGRFSANLTLLRASCYPLKLDSVKEDSIKKHLAECVDAGLVVLYTVEGKSLLEMQDFGQRINGKSKFPGPDDATPVVPGESRGSPEVSRLGVSVSGVVSEVDKPAAPSGAELFDEFWTAYPKKKAKDDALKAFLKRKPDRALLDLMLGAIAWQRTTEDWVKDGGKFVPYPATWLNDGRWTDELPVAMPAGAVSTVPSRQERDPELTRLDIERARAVPMPAAIREQMEKLKQGATA